MNTRHISAVIHTIKANNKPGKALDTNSAVQLIFKVDQK